MAAFKPYKEKLWFKPNGEENITTGYSLRGRQRLKSSVEGLIKIFERGAFEIIEEVQLTVLDTRKVGVALEIKIAMLVKGESGIAMLKLYGPYSQQDKKDNVIMISKVKHNDEKFVTILAEQVIKPLIISFEKEENVKANEPPVKEISPIVNSLSVKGKKIKLLKCPHCDKTSYSSPGLKGHVTKMHQKKSKDLEKISINVNTVEGKKGETITLEESSTSNYDCQDCAVKTFSNHELQDHISKEHKFKCNFCGKQLDYNSKEHTQSEHTYKKK